MTYIDSERGTGRTTAQMKSAPRSSVFIWCNQHIDYPERLAREIDRQDLEIVRPSWLNSRKWTGLRMTGITVDHAAILDDLQWNYLNCARAYIR